MGVLDNIILGFRVCLTPINVLWCFVGCLGGTLIGVLPGLGPQAAIILLLPATLYLSPVSAIIMLAGIYYGSMYGGSTTSILVNIPGEAASIVTCLDGHQMAKQGRAGPALGISAFGSFIGGTFGIFLLTILARPISEFALRFGPPEYFSLMFLALMLLTNLSSGPLSKSLISALIGLLLGTIGFDLFTATPRFTFGLPFLMDGIGLIPVIMGLVGVSEVFVNVEQGLKRTVPDRKIGHLLPNKQEWKKSAMPIVRGTIIGSILGILPGGEWLCRVLLPMP
jgi:putative tricarboxylic transport membrane protein